MRFHLNQIERKTLYILQLLSIWFVSLSSSAQTTVSGNQSGIWTKATSPYLLSGTVTVPAGQTLTIEPGVEVRSQSYSDRILVNGTLVAKGTATDSIRFVRLTAPSGADSHGGYFDFGTTSRNSVLEYVVIDRWGDVSAGSGTAVRVNSSSVSIAKNSIRNSEGQAIVMSDKDSVVIRDNKFINNGSTEITCYASNLDSIYNNENAKILINSSSINKHSRWPYPGPNSYYFLNGVSITVAQNQVLTIEPGVEVRSQSYGDRILVNGSLVAKGTAADSIRFVRLTAPSGADSHGGYFEFGTTSRNSVLEYVVIDRWGDVSAGSGTAVRVNSSSVSITKNSIRNSEGVAISSAVTGLPLAIRSNTFFNSGILSSHGVVDIRCYAANLDSMTGNEGAKILIEGGTIAANTTWHYQGGANAYYILIGGVTQNGNLTIKQGVQLRLNGVSITVAPNQVLTIEPGVEVRSQSYSDRILVNGTLVAKGTATDSIRFVRLTAPSGSDSHGGYFDFGTTSRNSVLEYAVIDRWGDVSAGSGTAVRVNSSSVSITKNSIRNSEGVGLHYSANGSSNLTGSTISNNVVGIYISGGPPIISSCNIIGNTTYGINNVGSLDVDARNCWWGSSTGPRHPANPGGLGDSVSNKVLYTPWRQQPVNDQISDIGISELVSPKSDCRLTAAEIIKVKIKNYGTVTISGFEVKYQVNNGIVVSENVGSLSLTSGATADYTFTTRADLAAVTVYSIKAFTSVVADTIRNNDTLTATIQHTPVLAAPGNLQPAEGATGLNLPVAFSWSAVPGATYDLYIWKSADTVPSTPVAGNLSQPNTSYSGSILTYGGLYKWKVVSKNLFCQTASATQSFSLRSLPDLVVAEITAPSTGTAGSNINVSWKITNQGLGTTGTTAWADAVYLTEAGSIGNPLSGILIGNFNNAGTLDAGQSYTTPTHGLRIPQGAQGLYYLVLRTNRLNSLPEVTDTNNLKISGPVTISLAAPYKDVGVMELVSPKSDCRLTAGEIVKVKIKNYGNSDVDGFTVSYQVNSGVIITENAGSLSISAGGTAEFSFNAKADFSTPGIFRVKAFTTLMADSLLNNDTLNASIEHSPLIAAPGNLQPAGGAINLSVPVAFSWSVVTGATYDIYIWKASDTMPAIPVASNLTQISFSYSSNTLVYGTMYNWKVVAKNATCQTPSVVQSFSLRHLPDLVISEITTPQTAISEADITVSWKVTNQGLGTSGTTRWTDLVYLTESITSPFSGRFLGSFNNISALEANQSYTYPSQTFTIPQGTQGQYYIVIKTNNSNSLRELTDTNNVRFSLPVTINLTPPPDLQVVNPVVVAPTTAFSEDSITVSWTVVNLGTGPTTATSWTDAVYLSKEQVLNTGTATLLAQPGRSGALNVNGQYTRNVKYKLPARIEGTYYIHVFTDRNNQAFEYVKEDNNIGTSGAVNIILRPTPNLVVNSASVPYDTVSNKQTLKIDWIARNDGAVAARPVWYDEIRLTVDSFYTAPGQVLGAYTHRDSLQSLSATGAQLSVQLPANLAEGRQYIFIKGDYSNIIFEGSQENDNVSAYAGPIYVVNPDLKPLAVQAPPSAQTRQSISLSWTVENTGRGAVFNSTWNDFIYLSSDNVLNSGDIFLSSVSTNMVVSPGGQYVKQHSVTLPEGIQGSYHIIVVTDANNNVFEKAENNNHAYTPISISISPWPDLVIASIVSPQTDTAGTSINFSYTVRNNGTGKIENKSWTDRLYLSPGNDLNDPTKILLQQVNNQRTLDTGQTYTVSISAALPSLNFGQYYILAVTDEYNAVYENTNENNNRKVSEPVTIAAFPHFDLAAVSGRLLSSTTALTAGQTVAVEWLGKNGGTIPTITSSWEDAVYLSTNQSWDPGDRLLGSWTISAALAPNASYSQTKNITIPNDVNGVYYLLVNIDRTNKHNDTARTNNTMLLGTGTGGTDGIIISRPLPSDLLSGNFKAPAEGAAGQPFTLSYSVTNTGAGNTNTANWVDRVYLSSDYQLDGGDLPIGTFNHSGVLSPGSEYKDTQQVFIPVNISGNYIIILKTDVHNQVYEFDAEDNNLAFTSLFVQQQQPADLIVSGITIPAGQQTAGQFISINWTLQNTGINPVQGFFRDAVYLSTDTTWDVNDLLFAIKDTTISNLPQQATINRRLTQRLTNTAKGDYYIIVRTDILNNQLEVNDGNNTGFSASPMPVEVQLLTMGAQANDSLVNGQALYYRITVPASLAGETMLLSLNGNAANNTSNKLYLSYNKVPGANQYDFASLVPYDANQAITVPQLQAGTYYLLALGSEAKYQPVTLQAKIIPFEITKIMADKGGNTGGVTVRIHGAKFTDATSFKLHSNALGTITPAKIYYTDQTQVYATFNLLNAKTGMYNIVATQLNGDSTRLINGFEVVQGPGSSAGGGGEGIGGPGSGTGFVCQVVNIGFEDGLDVGVAHPGSARLNQYLTITIYFENKSSVDIPTPTRYFIASNKDVPVALSLDELNKNYNDLVLEFKEPDGPPGILRPGANGYVKIYTRATVRNSLDFVIAE